MSCARLTQLRRRNRQLGTRLAGRSSTLWDCSFSAVSWSCGFPENPKSLRILEGSLISLPGVLVGNPKNSYGTASYRGRPLPDASLLREPMQFLGKPLTSLVAGPLGAESQVSWETTVFGSGAQQGFRAFRHVWGLGFRFRAEGLPSRLLLGYISPLY